VLYADGSAWLIVRRPMTSAPTVGTYSYKPDKADFAELAKAGPDGVSFDAHGDVPDEMQALHTLAARVAEEARQKPQATASFYSPPLGPSDNGEATLVLQVVGGGKRAVQFDLDPLQCAVLFSNFGEPVGWLEFPELESGFVTPDAEGLGGLGRRAEVEPDVYGALVVKTQLPTPVTGVSMQVAGSLYDALPDAVGGDQFEVRTDIVDL